MKRVTTLIASLALGASMHATTTVDSNITTDTVWTNDDDYLLDGQIYVVNDATLTIEPGTVIRAKAGTGSESSALIISRGSKIYALGTPSAPIIFTAEADLLDGVLDEQDTERWGGLIVLGSAILNSANDGTIVAGTPPMITDNIEGLDNSPENDFTEYGGTDNEDNSGIIRYVSIRHGGTEIGAGNEINGLTMGGVGSGTTVEFVEVFANKDDGFEWFGGAVNARFLVAAFGNDDSFDYDLGWTGYGQFWASFGTINSIEGGDADHAGEHDGVEGGTPVPGTQFRGMGSIFNATYVGPGSAADLGADVVDEGVFEISDDAGARYYNSIFMKYGGHGVDVKSDALDGLTEVEGDTTRIDFSNNIWFDNGDGSASALSPQAEVVTFLTDAAKNNTIEDPEFHGISRTTDGGLDPRPLMTSPALTNDLKAYPDMDFFMPVDYQGAFSPDSNWMYGWTALARKGYLPNEIKGAQASPVNISTRGSVSGGFDTMIAGFVVEGEVPKAFLIRAVGPKLVDFPDFDADKNTPMPNPHFSVVDVDGITLFTSLDWVTQDDADAIRAVTKNVGAQSLDLDGGTVADTSSAAGYVVLNPGLYTVVVFDEALAAGSVLVEVFDADL